MASAPQHFDVQHCDEQPGLLQPPQFRLRTLMLVTAICCGLFALFSIVSLLLSAFIVLFLLLVAAHVIGNALGTRLRDGAPAPSIDSRDAGAAQHHAAVDFSTRPQRLRETTRLERRTLVWTGGGAAAGGLVGGIGLSIVNWANISVPAVVLAALSSAVLGGLATFLAACFLTTIRTAWREALNSR
jgi:hypothetical protein